MKGKNGQINAQCKYCKVFTHVDKKKEKQRCASCGNILDVQESLRLYKEVCDKPYGADEPCARREERGFLKL